VIWEWNTGNEGVKREGNEEEEEEEEEEMGM
jgi:hypothetical protein